MRRRQLNLGVLAGVVVAPFVLGGVIYLLHECMEWRNAPLKLASARKAQTDWRRQSEEALQETGDDRKTKREEAARSRSAAGSFVTNYVKRRPRDPEGWITLGFIEADSGRIQPAYLHLERAIKDLPERTDVRKKLAELGIVLGRFWDAEEHLKDFLLKASPNDRDLLEMLVRCQIGRSEFSQAESTLQKIIQTSPNRLTAYRTLAEVLEVKLQRSADADAVIDKMIDTNRGNGLAYYSRVGWLSKRLTNLLSQPGQNVDLSEVTRLQKQLQSDAEEALRLIPDDANVSLLAIDTARKFGNNDRAREIVQIGVEKHPSDARFESALSDLEWIAGKADESLAALDRAVQLDAKDLGIKSKYAQRLIDQGNAAKAESVVGELRTALVKASRPTAYVDYLEGRIHMIRSEWRSAILQFESARVGFRDDPQWASQAEFWLGQAYGAVNSPVQQLECFRRAVLKSPSWILAKLQLAKALFSSNLFQDAEKEYRQICGMTDPPLDAFLGLAHTLMRLNQSKPMNERNWTEFDGLLKQLEQAQPEKLIFPLGILRAQRQIVSDDVDGAAKTLQLARDQSPQKIELWMAQVNLACLQRDWDQVNDLLKQAEMEFGDTSTVRAMRGRIAIQRLSHESAAIELRTLSVAPQEWDKRDRLQLATEMAIDFSQIGQFDDAKRLLQTVCDAQPKNTRVRIQMLDIALRTKDRQLIEQILEEIRSVAGERELWHYGQACLLVIEEEENKNHENFTAALSHLEKAEALRPEWGRISKLSADILLRLGKAPSARVRYLKAIQLGEKSVDVTVPALELLLQERRFQYAGHLIQQLHLSDVPFTERMSQIELETLLQLGLKDRAFKLVAQLMNDPELHLQPIWLGNVLLRLEKFELAESQYRAAIQVDATKSQPWIELVTCLAMSRRPEQAMAVIAEAKQSVSEDQRLLAVGQCYQLLGEFDLAHESFQSAMEQSPNDLNIRRVWIESLSRRKELPAIEIEVRKFLKEAEGKLKFDDQAELWAQRKLISVLTQQGNGEKFDEALLLVDELIKRGGNELAQNQRLKVDILLTRQNRANRDQAIAILEELIDQGADGDSKIEDRFRLAPLYVLNDELKKARKTLISNLGSKTDDHRVFQALIKLEFLENQIPEAEASLNRLKEIAPDDATTIALESQLLIEQKKYDQLFKRLSQFEARPAAVGESPDSSLNRKVQAANQYAIAMEKLNQRGEKEEAARFESKAESVLKKIVSERPQDVLVMAVFLAKTSRIESALGILQDHVSAATWAHVVSIAESLKVNSRFTSEQCLRFQNIIHQIKDPQVNRKISEQEWDSLSNVIADMLSWQDEASASKAAEAAYRELILQNSNDNVALNNLAVHIANTSSKVADLNAALALVNKAIASSGRLAHLLDTRGMVYFELGNSPKALADFTSSLREMKSAEAYFHLALAQTRLNVFGTAAISLERADLMGLSESQLHPAQRKKLRDLRKWLKK